MDITMNREEIIKLVTPILTFPVVFYLLAYFNEGLVPSITNFISYALLAFAGGCIGWFYAYFCYKLFIKHSFVAGFIPVIILLVITTRMDISNLIVLGDLCLILSCWFIASELASIKNKTV